MKQRQPLSARIWERAMAYANLATIHGKYTACFQFKKHRNAKHDKFLMNIAPGENLLAGVANLLSA